METDSVTKTPLQIEMDATAQDAISVSIFCCLDSDRVEALADGSAIANAEERKLLAAFFGRTEWELFGPADSRME
jgi:hypothetical protein